jgi:hypothetical protein
MHACSRKYHIPAYQWASIARQLQTTRQAVSPNLTFYTLYEYQLYIVIDHDDLHSRCFAMDRDSPIGVSEVIQAGWMVSDQ